MTRQKGAGLFSVRLHVGGGNQTPEQFESEWQLFRTAKEGIY
ncbi:MAG TPA: hypothetical protein VFM04_00560 [Candidatus Methylomirabilis sp.]|nr:hypothetical protein [Candidatus Methylomirabilis sp.]